MSDVAPPTAAALRAALVARCGDDSPPGAWRAAAAAAGVSGADAFLCHLSRSISGALEHLAASAEAARVRLQSVRESRAADVLAQSHLDVLESSVETTETTKRVALERELCAVDAALERLRSERGAAAEATLGGLELEALQAELTARLEAAEAQLLALPTSVVEPPHVGLAIDEPSLLAGSKVFGCIIAPLAVMATDLAFVSSLLRAYPGATLLFHLALQGARHASQSAEELEVSLGAVAAAMNVEALLETEGVAPQPLLADVRVNVPRRCIAVAIYISDSAPIGSSVCFGPLTVSGRPVAGLAGALRVELPCPADLSPEHAAWLQSELPPGGPSSPGAWDEVYRATTHGFDAATFHARCDGRARLFVLVREKECGWLFGGFTAVGFSPPPRDNGTFAGTYADPAAFLFSLTNSLGRPEKLESRRTGKDLYYGRTVAAVFGGGNGSDLFLCENAHLRGRSLTNTGKGYAVSASTGAHPMARGRQEGWCAAEVVAWVV